MCKNLICLIKIIDLRKEKRKRCGEEKKEKGKRKSNIIKLFKLINIPLNYWNIFLLIIT